MEANYYRRKAAGYLESARNTIFDWMRAARRMGGESAEGPFESEEARERELEQMYEHVKALVRRVESERGWGRGEGVEVTDEDLAGVERSFLVIEHEENLRRLRVSRGDPREGEDR